MTKAEVMEHVKGVYPDALFSEKDGRDTDWAIYDGFDPEVAELYFYRNRRERDRHIRFTCVWENRRFKFYEIG